MQNLSYQFQTSAQLTSKLATIDAAQADIQRLRAQKPDRWQPIQQKLRAEWTYDSNAIEGGCGIKGLGVSFASKHLRLLLPERYAVLDEVLSTGLGFALNPTGYALFMREIKRFKEKYSIRHSLAHIEWAIFGLVRQSVRGLPPSSIDITKNQTY